MKSRGKRLYQTALFYTLIHEKLTDLIERTFQREESLYLACNDRNAFSTSEEHKKHSLWSCQTVCESLTFLLNNMCINLALRVSYTNKLSVFR